jgi:hypothetical protein
MCNSKIKKLLIIAPPGTAKTTWLLAYTACHIAFLPEYPTILAAVSSTVADKRSVSIRNIVESESFKEIFPDVEKAKGFKWEQTEWSVAPRGLSRPGRIHPTLFSVGMGGSVIGSRGRLLISDDLLDLNNTRTAAARELTYNWIHSQFLSRQMASLGRVIMIGNSYHHDDAYSRIKKQNSWTTCHTPLLSNGQSVYASITYPSSFEGETIGEAMTQAELAHE